MPRSLLAADRVANEPYTMDATARLFTAALASPEVSRDVVRHVRSRFRVWAGELACIRQHDDGEVLRWIHLHVRAKARRRAAMEQAADASKRDRPPTVAVAETVDGRGVVRGRSPREERCAR